VLETGKLSEIKVGKAERKYSDYIKELEQIHGIGHKTAYDLVTKHNIKTIAELKKAYNDGVIELNGVVVTGLKYHGVYKENIPRAEIDKVKVYLEKQAKAVDKRLTVTICGSYRRLKSTSNDIDVLIAHPDVKTKLDITSTDNYLFKLIKSLKDAKFLLDDLTDKDYAIKYMGYCRLGKNPVRRIDLRYIPFDSYPTALLYFTGAGNFNKRMRTLAEQLGYMLNEYGLYKLKGDKKVRVRITSEEDVFDKLGMEYLLPEKRN